MVFYKDQEATGSEQHKINRTLTQRVLTMWQPWLWEAREPRLLLKRRLLGLAEPL